MDHLLNMEIYFDVVECIKWMVNKVAQVNEIVSISSPVQNGSKRPSRSSLFKYRKRLLLKSLRLGLNSCLMITTMKSRPNSFVDKLFTMKRFDMAESIKFINVPFKIPMVYDVFSNRSNSQLSLIFCTNFFDLFIIVTAFKLISVPKYTSYEIDLGDDHTDVEQASKLLDFNRFVQASQRTQPFFSTTATQAFDFQASFKSKGDHFHCLEAFPTLILDDNNQGEFNELARPQATQPAFDIIVDEVPFMPLPAPSPATDLPERAQSSKIHITERQRFIEFRPIELNPHLTTPNYISHTSSGATRPEYVPSQQQEQSQNMSQFLQRQNLPPLKRRRFIILGLSKKQRISTHLHSRISNNNSF